MANPSKEEAGLSELQEKVLAAEKTAAAQVTWASTPAAVPSLRGKGILFSGVVGNRRQYAFLKEYDREQFVYNRHDTLFTVNRDLRQKLGLSPPEFKGTMVAAPGEEPKPLAPRTKARNRFRK